MTSAGIKAGASHVSNHGVTDPQPNDCFVNTQRVFKFEVVASDPSYYNQVSKRVGKILALLLVHRMYSMYSVVPICGCHMWLPYAVAICGCHMAL